MKTTKRKNRESGKGIAKELRELKQFIIEEVELDHQYEKAKIAVKKLKSIIKC